MTTATPQLAPPGAGIPLLERIVGRYFILPRLQRKTSWDDAVARFVREGERVLAVLESVPLEKRDTRVLIDHLRGLEDSSRYWSAAQTVEHLIITGAGMTMIIGELTQGRVPAGEVDTAKVKPRDEIAGAKAAGEFRTFLSQAQAKLKAANAGSASRLTMRHPWFGPLSAKGWLCLIGIHQRLHRQQLERIARGLAG